MSLPLALTTALATALPQVQTGAGAAVPHPRFSGNVLLIVADDVGCDMLQAFSRHPDAPPTPNLDALIARGVSFQAAYTDPICSPSRACILTGRYSFRTGVGNAIQPSGSEPSLDPAEVTLPEALRATVPWPIESSAIGKWHLSAPPLPVALEPNLQGFDWFEGITGNLFLGQTYYAHNKIRNGLVIPSVTYITTEQVSDAEARAQRMQEPWLLYLAFNAGHAPWHVPPANLHTYNLSSGPNQSPDLHYRASVEALDTELGRLFAGIGPARMARTTVIFIGDNGSPSDVVTAPSNAAQVKGTLYEGGARVPLIIAGPDVVHPGSSCYALVNSVDLFPTVLELFGAPTPPRGPKCDGVSLRPYLEQPWRTPLRQWVFATRFSPNGPGPYTSLGRMLRDSRFKLIERAGQSDLFFDMASPQGESVNVLGQTPTPEQKSAHLRLKHELTELVGG